MSKPCFDLQGKSALVCGASGGLGEACARLISQAGAKLVLASNEGDKLAALAGELGDGCSYVELDLTDEKEAQALVDTAVERMGRLDILVNAQGINRPQKAEDASPENWDAVMNINLRSVFFLSQAAGRQMIKQKYGRIVSISSQAGIVALPLRSAYCSSKAGVIHLAKELAKEWAPYNITVNTVAPTFVETNLVVDMFKDPEFKQYVLDNIPLGRMAYPQEIGYAVLYLVSDLAAMVTGHTLVVDGGWSV